jgi:hypothetical protein
MKLTTLSASDASVLALRTLGLDPELIDLTSTEGLAASLRRAASFMCPTSPGRLVDAVLGAVRPVSPEGSVDRDRLIEILDLLIGEGDLLELRHEAERQTRLLYLGPPSFIKRDQGTYLLVGVRPYGVPLVDAELAGPITRDGHTRTLHLDDNAVEQLARSGLRQINPERWVASPRKESAVELLQRIGTRLDAAGPSGDIEDLVVLDPATPARYYKGRWRGPVPGDSGDFVARRPQAYGADLWCTVRLADGSPQKLVEFPIDDPLVPGRDEAWRMEMAIDAERRVPQVFRWDPARGSVSSSIVSFFSPLPGFAERYLQLVGQALPDAPRALFAFRVANGAMPGLSAYLAGMLWMKPVAEEGGL